MSARVTPSGPNGREPSLSRPVEDNRLPPAASPAARRDSTEAIDEDWFSPADTSRSGSPTVADPAPSASSTNSANRRSSPETAVTTPQIPAAIRREQAEAKRAGAIDVPSADPAHKKVIAPRAARSALPTLPGVGQEIDCGPDSIGSGWGESDSSDPDSSELDSSESNSFEVDSHS